MIFQEAFQQLSSKFRVFVRKYSVSTPQTAFSASAPLSPVESLTPGAFSRHAVLVPLSGQASYLLDGITLSLISIDYSLVKATGALTDSLVLSLSTPQLGNLENVAPDFVIQIPNNIPTEYSNVTYASGWKKTFRTKCEFGVVSNVSLSCPYGSAVVHHSCGGVGGELTTHCPAYTLSAGPVCSVLSLPRLSSGSRGNYDLEDAEVQYSTEHTVPLHSRT